MPIIISKERYRSQSRKFLEQYLYLQKKYPEDNDFKKVGRILRALKMLYPKDKVYAVKQLNYVEKSLILFSDERRSLLVQVMELLQKLILHKKLNKKK
ncbi:MAG: hypothetical protein OEL89_04445 [Candidatus Peregrinibacteria bacterium]|nr:hypothetical protein [Candidatus Peregrinibacteria bacterium]